jgi:3'-phosphoadenosine 5'-phosphosulfate sulfotransferase (PAPS reductase)/FAD synthetase
MSALGMTRPQREARVTGLIDESRRILSGAIAEHITGAGRTLAATAVMFSGGNDSTVLAHLFRHHVTHAAHANTGVGIEQTRDFVRNTCEEWGLPLIERKAPRDEDSYRALVLDRGFPGPAMHWKMYQRLKERAFREIRRELIGGRGRSERIVFLAGRRREESERREDIQEVDREGAIVWVSPLVNWTKLDMNTYRLMAGDVPRNEVADLIHMSGECLCGAFASPGERAEVSSWYPVAFEQMAELEAAIANRTDIPDHRKTWGWGADPALKALEGKPSRTGRACSSCASRYEQLTLEGVA